MKPINRAFNVLEKYTPVVGAITGVLGLVDAATLTNVGARMQVNPGFWSALFALAVLAFSVTMLLERREFNRQIEEAKNER